VKSAPGDAQQVQNALGSFCFGTNYAPSPRYARRAQLLRRWPDDPFLQPSQLSGGSINIHTNIFIHRTSSSRRTYAKTAFHRRHSVSHAKERRHLQNRHSSTISMHGRAPRPAERPVSTRTKPPSSARSARVPSTGGFCLARARPVMTAHPIRTRGGLSYAQRQQTSGAIDASP
jgi:hypothetical protein